MRAILAFAAVLLLSASSLAGDNAFSLPDSGLLALSTNMGDRVLFENDFMYLFYSREYYIVEFPFALRNESENLSLKSVIISPSSVSEFVKAINFYGWTEFAGPFPERGQVLTINYSGGGVARLFVYDKTYLVFEAGQEKRTFVSPMTTDAAADLVATLLDDGERTSLPFVRMTLGDQDRKAFTKFNNNLRTVRLWTGVHADREVVTVIWEPCGCQHNPQDPNYKRFNKSYLYYYIREDQVQGKEILKENRTTGGDDRDLLLLEKDYLSHHRTPPPATTTPPTAPPATTPPATTTPPTDTPLPTAPPTEPPTWTPVPEPRVSEDALFSFLASLLFGGVAFALAFYSGSRGRRRKAFKQS